MSDIRELQAKRSEILDAMQGVADAAENENRALTEDEEKRWNDHQSEIDLIDGRIERQRALADAKRANAAAQVDDAVDLVKADNETRVEVKTPAKFGNVGEQLIAVARATASNGSNVDPRLSNLEAEHRAALGASSPIPQDGGFLVQNEFSTALLEASEAEGVIFPSTMQIPVSGGEIELPFVDESSRADGSRNGSLQIYRNHEGDSVTAERPLFGQHKIALEDLSGLAYATDNMLADAPALAAIFQQTFAAEFAFKLDDEIINGTGSGEMLGVLNSNALVSVAKETGQAATTVVYENVVNMWSRMRGRFRAGANWYINQDVEPELFNMSLAVGTGGAPAYLPANGLSGAPFSTLMGRPVRTLEQSATLGTVGDIILMNPGRYVTVSKGGLAADQSMHVRFITHEQTFRWKMRVNGQPIERTTLTPNSGSTNTLSSYVALATRS